MQSSEMRACEVCDRGLAVDGAVTFHRIRFEQFRVDPVARHDKQAFAALYKGMKTYSYLQPDEPLDEAAILIDEPADLIVCHTCACADGLMRLAIAAREKLHERKAAAGNINKGDQQ